MFDLDKAIADWSANLQKSAFLQDKEIEELHDHLCCLIDSAKRQDLNDQQAFDFAAQKIGLAQQLNREYLKIGFIDRLRHLPKSLTAIACLFASLSLIEIPFLFFLE